MPWADSVSEDFRFLLQRRIREVPLPQKILEYLRWWVPSELSKAVV